MPPHLSPSDGQVLVEYYKARSLMVQSAEGTLLTGDFWRAEWRRKVTMRGRRTQGSRAWTVQFGDTTLRLNEHEGIFHDVVFF